MTVKEAVKKTMNEMRKKQDITLKNEGRRNGRGEKCEGIKKTKGIKDKRNERIYTCMRNGRERKEWKKRKRKGMIRKKVVENAKIMKSYTKMGKKRRQKELEEEKREERKRKKDGRRRDSKKGRKKWQENTQLTQRKK